MAAKIGMSVPGQGLGLGGYGGASLADEVTNLTEEEKRRRQRALAAERLLPNASAPAKALGLTASGSYGALGGYGRLY